MDGSRGGQQQQQQSPRGSGGGGDLLFDECPARYTSKMWMDDLERLERSDNGASSLSQPQFLLYPLHGAVFRGRLDVAQIMLDKGMYDKDGADPNGNTPIHIAAFQDSAGLARALLAAGADASLRNHHDLTALDVAIMQGHVGVVREVVEHGVDVTQQAKFGRDGDTALHTAVHQNQADVVSLLCLRGGFDANVLNGGGWAPLHEAARQGEDGMRTTQALLDAGADSALRRGGDGVSPLDLAVARGHGGVLKAILQRLDDVDSSGANGHTALHYAAVNFRPGVIEILLGAGANAELGDSDGNTPLHGATTWSCVEAVAVLLNHGVKVDTKRNSGQTALHVAAARAGTAGTAEVVDLLLRGGADETAVDNDHKTPADVIGARVEEPHGSLAEDVERVRELLANAPADRAWRRRGFLVLCRAHYPAGRVRLGCKKKSGHAGGGGGGGGGGGDGIAKRTRRSRSRAETLRAEADWAGVASVLMGAGSDPVSLMGDGADIVFEAIVGFL